ncbi:MAG TPA: hypothetical protein VJB82_04830 [Candidatus Peribacterales bacterium]|nr:hypothetical protein [Candidatus Peribacterales bacterium]
MNLETSKVPDGQTPHRVITMDESPSMVRPLVESRLRLFEKKGNLSPNSTFNLDDSAYTVLEQMTNGNPAYTLFLVREALENACRANVPLPHMLTAADITSLGITQEDFKQYWDSQLRNVDYAIIEIDS